MSKDSRDLARAASSGDKEAMRKLLEGNLSAMRAYVRQHLGEFLRGKESTSDIVQSACREVLAGMEQFEFRTESLFRHWLFETVHRKIVDRARYYRAQKRDPARELQLGAAGPSSSDEELVRCYETFCTPSKVAQANEIKDNVERAMDSLPQDYRKVISFSYLVGLSHAEIGEVMGRKASAVRVLLYRGLRRLEMVLRERGITA